MTKPLEKTIVAILLILCMPFSAAGLMKFMFGNLFLSIIAGSVFISVGAWLFTEIYPEKED
ncbi:hypothetical protein LCGC14_1139590 [marine sediment metagenome]|uniref:Uncharacterized protein n=1 Tax=marine sediment metagenome TaxID=412755 RepID=A0A0F9Q4H3_9ZZZZ